MGDLAWLEIVFGFSCMQAVCLTDATRAVRTRSSQSYRESIHTVTYVLERISNHVTHVLCFKICVGNVL
jgi:hypothetical protein